jgi:glycosyltransferase involved in cell wall biosynthesis
MHDLLLERGVPADKLSVIYNWTDEQLMRPAAADHSLRNQLGLSDCFMLMYAGNHGAAQRLDNAIDAMTHLSTFPDVHLVMVGDGSSKALLQERVAKLGLSTVHFEDRVDVQRVPGLMASADLQLVSLANQDLFQITMPSKVQSIMACAQPVLLSGAGDAARAVEDAGAGFTCPPDNPQQLAAAIAKARATPKADLEAMGRAGQAYYQARMSEAVNSRALAGKLRLAARGRTA